MWLVGQYVFVLRRALNLISLWSRVIVCSYYSKTMGLFKVCRLCYTLVPVLVNGLAIVFCHRLTSDISVVVLVLSLYILFFHSSLVLKRRFKSVSGHKHELLD